MQSNINKQMIDVIAKRECISGAELQRSIEDGTVVVPQNIRNFNNPPVAIGKGLKTKVNANIGTSADSCSLEEELHKVEVCIKAGADTLMDLSTGGDIDSIRREIRAASTIPLGTVPIYQAMCEALKQKKKPIDIDSERLFEIIESQSADGVDFITVHCGITLETVSVLKRNPRLVGVVSRGGSLLVKWITANNRENPLYEQYDRLLKIAKKYGVTLSLGDGLRPGCIADATDAGQLAELSVLGELVLRARQADVQVMIEGPGHVPLNQIEANVKLAKRIGHDAPLYFLGPLVTDIAPGYDHITSAIGGSIAASAGVDYLCYVTPAEHIRLPNIDDVYEGIMATRIAAHAADIVKEVPGAKKWDDTLSKYRKERNWKKQQELSLDPERFKRERGQSLPQQEDVCTMCGALCSMKDD